MIRKISTVLLSLLMVWYAAAQVEGKDPDSQQPGGIRVHAQDGTQLQYGEEIYGQIRVTAAMRELSQDKIAAICFILEGEGQTYTRVVEITPDCWDENDLLSASAVFMDLNSGLYTLRIERAIHAGLDYILAEDGDESRYMIEGDTITFELADCARLGSAWFILSETEA